MVEKQFLKDILKKQVLQINFVKKDGTKRLMKCSLREDIVPKIEKTTTKKPKPENSNVLAVWDLEKEAFRSFKLDSLVEYSILEEGYEL
jgi:hypothetical protein